MLPKSNKNMKNRHNAMCKHVYIHSSSHFVVVGERILYIHASNNCQIHNITFFQPVNDRAKNQLYMLRNQEFVERYLSVSRKKEVQGNSKFVNHALEERD